MSSSFCEIFHKISLEPFISLKSSLTRTMSTPLLLDRGAGSMLLKLLLYLAAGPSMRSCNRRFRHGEVRQPRAAEPQGRTRGLETPPARSYSPPCGTQDM